MRTKKTKKRISILKMVWIFNLILAFYYVSTIYGVHFFKSSILEYSNIKSDVFDGTTYPISYVPDWTKSKNTNKSLNFSDSAFEISDFVEIPKYNPENMQDDSGKNKDIVITRYTYPVLYMGSYRLNYTEYDGSHPAVDIRAPIGTPVKSIANGVVVKVKNSESGDGKYVVIRHDDVNYNGNKETVFSSYEHLSEIIVQEGVKIKKGEVFGKVGITGITTTPHLHFQIDKQSASFSPYWPYTFKEASDLGLDFFSAINVGLGKENAIAYTINPMEFVQNNLNSDLTLNSAPESTKNIDSSKNTESTTSLTANDMLVANSQLIASSEDTAMIFANSGITEQVQEAGDIEKPIVSIDSSTENIKDTGITRKVPGLDQIFNDIPLNSKYYTATAYLYNDGITKGYEDNTFRPEAFVSRSEALIFIFRLYNISTTSNTPLYFSDIKANNFLVPFLQKALDLGLISRNKKFRPNDRISRAEIITMLIKASKSPLSTYNGSYFSDVNVKDWYSPYVNTFAEIYLGNGTKNKSFDPNNVFNRGQIAQILYTFYLKK